MKLAKILAPLYLLLLSAILGLALLTDQAVTALARLDTETSDRVIIIDAGHGGIDGGATSCTGVLESQLNLQIALRLEDLMHLLGMETQMIRRTDVSVYTEGSTIAAQKVSDLKQRVRIVNETEDALLISIHQNTFPDGRYSGAQVFVAHNEESRLLGEKLQANLIRTLNPGSHRKCKQADGIYLMEHIQRPGILLECGFLSNIAEEAKLRSTDYQQQLCAVIAATISAHWGDGK